MVIGCLTVVLPANWTIRIVGFVSEAQVIKLCLQMRCIGLESVSSTVYKCSCVKGKRCIVSACASTTPPPPLCLYLCLSVCLSLSAPPPSFFLSLCLCMCLSLCLSVLSDRNPIWTHSNQTKRHLFFVPRYLPPPQVAVCCLCKLCANYVL